MNKRKIGVEKEGVAETFLISNGYEVLERNFFSRYGELDLVCQNQGYLVFVEVKYRSSCDFGYPEEAVTYKKAQSMIKTANYYMYQHHISSDTPCRFDMVSILGDQIQIIENCLEV